MLASLADAPLADPQLVYEPKYDGIRAIVEVGPRIHIWSRLGNEKTAQFPAIVGALEKWKRRLKQPVVLDGEIVALDEHGEPRGNPDGGRAETEGRERAGVSKGRKWGERWHTLAPREAQA
jgi:ATP-dependent DNA ligase